MPVFSLHNGPVPLYHSAVLVDVNGPCAVCKVEADCHSDHIWSHLLFKDHIYPLPLFVPLPHASAWIEHQGCTARPLFGSCVTILQWATVSCCLLRLFCWKIQGKRQPSHQGASIPNDCIFWLHVMLFPFILGWPIIDIQSRKGTYPQRRKYI